MVNTRCWLLAVLALALLMPAVSAAAPTITAVNSPAAIEYTHGHLISNVTLSEQGTVWFTYDDGLTNNSMTLETGTNDYYNDTFVFANGVYDFTFYISTDEETVANVIVNDTQAPTISESPADASILTRGATINFTVMDNTAYLTPTYSLNGGAYQELTAIDGTFVWYVSTTSWLKGANTIVVNTTDVAPIPAVETYTYTISNTAPTGTMDAMPSMIRSNETIAINVTASDIDGIADVDSVTFYYTNDSANTAWILIGTDATASGSIFSADWNTQNLPVSDSTTFKIRANISDGDAVATVDSEVFTVANHHRSPSVVITNPNNGGTLSGTINITWTTTDLDNDKSIANVSYCSSQNLNTCVLISSVTDTGSLSWSTSGVGSNNYYMRIVVMDAFGLTDSDWSDTDFIISSGGSSSSNNNDDDSGDFGSGGGGLSESSAGFDVSRIISAIEAGTPEIIDINNANLALTKVTVITKLTVGDVRIKIRSMTDSPTTVSPSGKIYQYLEFDTSNLPDVDLASANIEFKVPKSWFTTNSADKDTVRLKRYVSNGWRDLTTTYVKAEGDYYYYSASTPGFSYFAIIAPGSTGTTATQQVTAAAATTEETAGATTETTEEGKGFLSGVTGGSIANMFSSLSTDKIIGLLVSIIVVCAFVGLIFFERRKNKGKSKEERNPHKFHFKLPKIHLPDASEKSDTKESPYNGKYVKIKLKK